MAIFSMHHSSIGKTTQSQPYTAAAHVDYITRKNAMSRLDAERVPADKAKAAAFMRVAEDKVRKNGRVADKLMLALPRELNVDQKIALVRSFAEAVTDGRAPWLAAFHDKGKDALNPHCHLMICDRDSRTGKRVFGTSEKGSTERLRLLWETHTNAALAKANRQERVDRRTLEAQGKARQPTIHVGVKSRQLILANRRVFSQVRQLRNHCQARTRDRVVAYPTIDHGQLRLSFNVEVRRKNLMASRAAGRESEYWQAIDEDAFLRDIRELKRLHAVLQREPGGGTFRSRDERMDRQIDHGPRR
jgi:hypothetical protein